MIYLDTSVALAHLLAEDRTPPVEIWDRCLVSSRLMEYELWTRIHAKGLARSHAENVNDLLGRTLIVEMNPRVLNRAREPFPTPVRTLDALHLATVVFLTENGQKIALASYDDRMVTCARRLKIPLLFEVREARQTPDSHF